MLVLVALVRSALATGRDGLTIDEPYHLVAGASYVRLGDYRLNPEHPPLVKLWAGLFLPERILPLPAFRPLADKPDERAFAEGAVYRDADPAGVQSRARAALLLLNGALLFLLSLALRRELGNAPALLATAFLAIDPTVAAHLPVAMTDLPVALLSALALLTAWRAARTSRPTDVAAAALALGGALGAKHSALVTAGVVAVVLLVGTFRRGDADGPSRARRAAGAIAVLAGAWMVLWGLYRFRFDESPGARDTFNRPLAAKLDDVGSPAVRGVLRFAEKTHLLPRAYLWGLADVTRSAVEGRSFPFFAFGTSRSTTPWWYFTGILLVKLPLGLVALSMLGVGWLATGRAEASARGPLASLAGLGAAFLAVLAASGAGYAGVRHALPVVPVLAALAGTAAAGLAAWGGRPRIALGAAFALAALPAIATPRPWEFHNLLVGGTANARRFFNNEGIDLGQRSLELARYAREVLRPRGETPFVDYPMAPELAERLELRTRPWTSADGTLTGTFLVSAVHVAPAPGFDYEAFRAVEPVDRRGNLLVYRGTFRLPWLRARQLLGEAMARTYGPSPDPVRARDLFADAAALHPRAYVAALELGNAELRFGRPAAALKAYERALANVPDDDARVRSALSERIARLRAEPGAALPPLRNPWLE